MKFSNSFEDSSNQQEKLPESGVVRLQGLQREIPRVSLQPELEAIKAGNISTEDPSQEELNKLKIEINALAAFSIQEIWSGIKSRDGQEIFTGLQQLIKENPLRLPDSSTKFDKSFYTILTPDQIRNCIHNKSATDTLLFIEEHTHTELVHHMYAWCSFHEDQLTNLPKANVALSESDRAFERYKKIIAKRKRIDPHLKDTENIPEHIKAGMGTAVNSIFGVLFRVPALFEEQFNRKISTDELKTIFKSSITLILKIAGSEIGVFLDLKDIAGHRKPEDDEVIKIVEDNGNLTLELTDFATKSIKVKNPEERLRTGCPAIVAKGSDGKSMMFEMHQWIMNLAEEFYFPKVVEN